MSHHMHYGTVDSKLKTMHEAQFPDGVVVDPTPITSGEEITIFYNGLLATSGASQVYVHVGYGLAADWRQVQDLRMSRTGWGFVKTLEMPDEDRFNFCFHDGYGNWDNNSGVNWSYIIHNGRSH